MLSLLLLLALAPPAPVAPGVCADPLACVDACEEGAAAACTAVGKLEPKELQVLWARRACTGGDAGGCVDLAAYAGRWRGPAAAVEVVGPLCERGVVAACDELVRAIETDADDATRSKWAPVVGRACGAACEAAAVHGVREPWAKPLVAATRARCERGGSFESCVDLLSRLDPRNDGRAFYAKLADRAAGACRGGDLDACRLFDLTASQAKALGISEAKRDAARAAAFDATLKRCVAGGKSADAEGGSRTGRRGPCATAASLARTEADEARVEEAKCAGSSRPCATEGDHDACRGGDVGACIRSGDVEEACRLGDKGSCFTLAVKNPTDKSALDAACRSGAAAACLLAKMKPAPARLDAKELDPPAAAIYDLGAFNLETGPTRAAVAPTDIILVREASYDARGVLIREQVFDAVWRGPVPVRRRTWFDVDDRPRRDEARVVDLELLVIADAAGAPRP